jgi:DNA polymerase III alpha subunit (gram-positive type)
MTRIIVFDVETTGLLPKNEYEKPPHILQLSYMVFDDETRKIIKKYNTYIKVDEDVIIRDDITQLTGITKEKCREEGVPILEALYAMYFDYSACNCVVAHNMKFDTTMIRIELERHDAPNELRNLMNPAYEEKLKMTRYCTMMHSIDLCAISVKAINKKGENYTYNKWPKLCELHQYLFGYIPDGLHDSMVDVEVCLRCYIQLLRLENTTCLG